MEGQATYRRIAVKIGSNVLTRSDGTLNVTRMSAIVDQVATLRHMGVEVILVSSGAVAAGRSMMRRRGVAPLDAVSERMLFSAVGKCASLIATTIFSATAPSLAGKCSP